MRRPIPTAALAAAALACAAPRPVPEAAPAAAPPRDPTVAPAIATAPAGAPPRIAAGADAAAVRRALGDPVKVETIASAASPGTRYERWIYSGGREVVFIDGKVADVLP